VGALRLCLLKSLELRILNIPSPPKLPSNESCRVAVLFSGGLDCTVLARMAHDLLPQNFQIDLINVAFENPRVIQAAKNTLQSKRQLKQSIGLSAGIDDQSAPLSELNSDILSPFECCPDRETGRKSFQELIQVCPTRIWTFVAESSILFCEMMSRF
jgi:asparagine synthetase B (glutamine-hydrolysing)